MDTTFFYRQLEELKERKLRRSLKTLEGEQGPWVVLDGRRVLNLSSNNYLGLASHPKLKEASARATQQYGCGSGASRLICGNMALHETLEGRLAAFKHSEAALLYGSGYAANVGIISSLARAGDFVFSDELNHASIIDGCRLSHASVSVFPHNDVPAVEEQLRDVAQTSPDARRLIVVEGVFSMDGDFAPLPELAKLADKYDALLMVDEAHATGVLGPGGRGLVAHFGLERRVPIIMSTLSKALGGFGAFVTCSRDLREYLLNTSRSFIFTTALPPAVVASALAALDVLEEEPALLQRLQENADYLRTQLKGLGYNTLHSQSQIMPVVIGDAARAISMAEQLFREGVLAAAVRPPTVPEGTSRLRVSVMATHTREDLDFAIRAFEKIGRQSGII